MSALFRLPESVKHEPAIDEWFARQASGLNHLAYDWFTAMRRCGDDVREVLHDGHPTICVGDAAFAYVNAFRAHVNVGFFFGSELPDPVGLLEGTGRLGRHVKLRPDKMVNSIALRALIEAAYADIKKRLAAVR